MKNQFCFCLALNLTERIAYRTGTIDGGGRPHNEFTVELEAKSLANPSPFSLEVKITSVLEMKSGFTES